MAQTPGSAEPKIGDMIRALRKKNNLSQYAASVRWGMSTTAVCCIEKGDRCPTPKALLRIAEVEGVEAEALMAAAGRFDKAVQRYLREHPKAVALVRALAETEAEDDVLDGLILAARGHGKAT